MNCWPGCLAYIKHAFVIIQPDCRPVGFKASGWMVQVRDLAMPGVWNVEPIHVGSIRVQAIADSLLIPIRGSEPRVVQCVKEKEKASHGS